MRVCMAQMATAAGDLDRTVARMVSLSERASLQGADLVVFPMAALTGPEGLAVTGEREGFVSDVMAAVERLARQVACACIVPVVFDLDGEQVAEAVLMDGGHVVPLKLAAYASSVLQAQGADPQAQDAPAPDLPEFTLGDLRLGVAFTYEDLDDYVDFDFDLDAVIYVAGYGYAIDDPSSLLGADLQEGRYVQDSEAMGAWVIGVGSLGCYGAQLYTGSSFAVTPAGELAASAPAFEESLTCVDVDPHLSGPLDSPVTPEVYDEPTFLWEALAMGVRDRIASMGRRRAVVVLDGSLSSQVLAVLATDALGPTNVRLLVSPVDEGERPACLALASNLRAESRDLRGAAGEQGPGLALGVAQAHALAWADQEDGVVLSPLTKTALALLDRQPAQGASPILPLGDVYLTDVVGLAHARNVISPVMPRLALAPWEVPSVPGVERDQRSDEEWTHAVDTIILDHVEWGHPLSELPGATGEDAGLCAAVVRALDDGGSWRLACGPCLIASTCTLWDARRPLGLAWHDVADRPSPTAAGEGLEELGRQVEEGGDVDWTRLMSLFATPADASGEDVPDDATPDAPSDEEPSEADKMSRLRDTLGWLHDFSQGGAFQQRGFGDRGDTGREGADGAPAGDEGRRPWQNPFSEN